MPEGALCDVKHRDGETFTNEPAGTPASRAESWRHQGEGGDILAYRPACYHRETTAEMARSSDPLQRLREATTEIEDALQEVQDALPEGYMVIRGGIDWAAVHAEEDMTDPENWRKGDIFTVTQDCPCGSSFVVGDKVRLTRDDDSRYEYLDGHDYWYVFPHALRFHSRP